MDVIIIDAVVDIHTLSDLRAIFSDAEILELYKSYRSTFEIITLAKRIQNISALEAIERHGVAPKSIPASSKASM